MTTYSAKISSPSARNEWHGLFIVTHSINATDAIILCVALDVSHQLRSQGDDLILVASDQRLVRAAQAEGLVTFNPETQNQDVLAMLVGPSH